MSQCDFAGCGSPHQARGLCKTHYLQQWHGGPLRPLRKRSTAKDSAGRFWEKVDRTGGCWIWTAAVSPSGYGVFRDGGRNHFAHRYAWKLFGNPDQDAGWFHLFGTDWASYGSYDDDHPWHEMLVDEITIAEDGDDSWFGGEHVEHVGPVGEFVQRIAAASSAGWDEKRYAPDSNS